MRGPLPGILYIITFGGILTGSNAFRRILHTIADRIGWDVIISVFTLLSHCHPVDIAQDCQIVYAVTIEIAAADCSMQTVLNDLVTGIHIQCMCKPIGIPIAVFRLSLISVVVQNRQRYISFI